jgi:hypothetical protein
MTTIEIPAYIDPAVLVPGQTVTCILDGTETVLTVLRVEPALICSKPDGTGVMVLAHTVVPVEAMPPGKRSPEDDLVREGTCATCQHASYQHRSTYRDAAGTLRSWSCVMFNCQCEHFAAGKRS